MLFISQPLGVGFSYSEAEPGSLNQFTGEVENSTYGVTGRWPVINATELDTTELAAVATWHVLQGFLANLPQLDARVGGPSKVFNLWTESYGGHYGPAFFDYFYDQNEMIRNGTTNGTELTFDTLGIINGILDVILRASFCIDGHTELRNVALHPSPLLPRVYTIQHLWHPTRQRDGLQLHEVRLLHA